MLKHLSFWIVVLFVPILVVSGNAVARWLAGLPHSATSDLILVVVVFDVAVAANAHEFQQFAHEQFRAHLVAIYASLIIPNLILWAVAVFLIERALVDRYIKTRKRYSKSPFWLVASSGLMAIFVLFSNTAIFAYGG